MTQRRMPPRLESNAELAERVDALGRRLEQVERTLAAVTRDATGVSVAGPCASCQRSLLLVRDGVLECPACGHSRPL
ncbi:hypothetical protein [Natronobeatus ordinarius]|uniref:hypothetical protein n=1 Tax=Natronobeatus ordinarius TaxID=2963433 RepID=UPI0020CD5435|nr:hypothetical protein [Natronobeatus ordinarius]